MPSDRKECVPPDVVFDCQANDKVTSLRDFQWAAKLLISETTIRHFKEYRHCGIQNELLTFSGSFKVKAWATFKYASFVISLFI